MRSTGGFTIVEMVVAMLIVSILASISVPSVSGYLNHLKLSVEAIKLQAALRKAQSIAFSEQVRCSLILDIVRCNYQIFVNGKRRAMYLLERGVGVKPSSCTFPVSNGKLSVTFTPEYGIPSMGGSIAICIGSLFKRLVVSAVTGRVRIE